MPEFDGTVMADRTVTYVVVIAGGAGAWITGRSAAKEFSRCRCSRRRLAR